MTEYDYSPEAYDRFMANQRRVSNWVHQSSSNARRFVDALNDAPSIHSSDSSSHTGSPSSSSRRSSHTARPPNSRSFTTPHPHAYHNPNVRPRGLGHEHRGGHHPHGPTYRRSPSPHSSSSSSTRRPSSHHHSYSTDRESSLSSSATPSPSSRHHSHHAHGNPVRAHSYPLPYQPPFPGPVPIPGYRPAPPPAPLAYKMIDSRTGREMPLPVHNVGPGQVLIPGGRRGQTYLVLPPDCRVTVPGSSSRHATSSSRTKHHSHSRQQQQPLLKRILGSIVGSRSSHSSSRHSHGRRSSY